MDEKEPLNCELHNDQSVFSHWGRYYCPRCKQWYNIKKD